jgi:hypothetical protein
LFTGCEKDIIDEELEQLNNIKRIPFSHFSEKAAGSPIYKSMHEHLDFNEYKDIHLHKNTDSLVPSTILTDEILLIEDNGMSYYTFKMLTPGAQDRFSNLIVHMDSLQNIVRSQVYEYLPDSTWLNDISRPYHGTLRVYDNTIMPTNDFFSKSLNGNWCPSTSGSWMCNLGQDHSPDNPGPSCTSWEYTISVSYAPCPGEPVDEVIVDPDLGNNGGGGITPTRGGTKAITIPDPPCDTVIHGVTVGIVSSDPCGGNGDDDLEPIEVDLLKPVDEDTQDFFDNLEDELEEFINDADQNDLREEADGFLKIEVYSTKAKLFITEYLWRKKADNEIEIDLVFYEFDEFVSNQTLQSLEQDYLGSMSDEEIVIYNTLNYTQQVDYLSAAKTAVDETIRRFPDSQLNGNGDAYRHTLWNALGTMRIGESLMSDLTTAHELKPHPDPVYNAGNHFKEIQMDTFNNAVGQQIGSNNWFFVSSDVLNALKNGELRKLSNLGVGNKATNFSQLISTD